MFLVIVNYIYGMEPIERHLEAHRVYLDEYIAQNIILCAGPQVPRNGGIFIINAESRAEAEKIVSLDPFVINQAAEHKIIEFTPTKFAKGFGRVSE